MFRRGGSTNTGIMSGLVDRRNYSTGMFGSMTEDEIRSNIDLLRGLQDQFALSNFQRAGQAADVANLGQLGAFRQGLTQSQLQADQDLARTGAYEGMQRLQQFGTGLGQLSGFGTPATPLPASPSPFSTALSTALGIGGLFGKFRS